MLRRTPPHGVRFLYRSRAAHINTGMAFNLAGAQAARDGATAPASSPVPPPTVAAPSPAAPQATAPLNASPAITDLTVTSAFELAEKFVDTLAQKHLPTFPGLVAITGRIDNIPAATKYPWHYDVLISDRKSTFYLELPKSEVEAKSITKGSHVRVIGRLVLRTWQGNIRPRLVVSQIESIDAPETAAARTSQMATLAKVHELRRIRHPFPVKDRLKVAVVCANSSQVLDDVRVSLKEAASHVHLEAVHVSFADEAEIARAIAGARGDILLVIRGGGSAGEFALFDTDAVLTALAESKSYRIVALGHTQHQTVADLVADYSAATPTAAAQFIREQMHGLLERLLIQRRMIEAEHARAHLGTREPTSAPYISEMRVEHKPTPPKVRRTRSKGPFVVLLLVIAALLLAYAKSRLFP